MRERPSRRSLAPLGAVVAASAPTDHPVRTVVTAKSLDWNGKLPLGGTAEYGLIVKNPGTYTPHFTCSGT
jgi:hypothetical protein